jgi:hypothetical protein
MALEPDASVIWHARDGERIKPGQLLCEIDASARALLTAERTGLNFVQLLSGTATMTATYVQPWPAPAPRSSTPARPCPACAWRRNTRCASAAAPTTASASTTAS